VGRRDGEGRTGAKERGQDWTGGRGNESGVVGPRPRLVNSRGLGRASCPCAAQRQAQTQLVGFWAKSLLHCRPAQVFQMLSVKNKNWREIQPAATTPTWRVGRPGAHDLL
jgi:hypothetical protein